MAGAVYKFYEALSVNAVGDSLGHAGHFKYGGIEIFYHQIVVGL